MKFVSHSIVETGEFAKKYVGEIVAGRANAKTATSGAFVLGLYGNLGSGKTAFTQAVAAALGIQEQITSPTYVIEKIYPLAHSLSPNDSQAFTQVSPQLTAFTHLIHIDAYRLESADEMKHLGWDEIATSPGNLIIVEWPEKIAALLPADHAKLKFTFVDETTREIESE